MKKFNVGDCVSVTRQTPYKNHFGVVYNLFGEVGVIISYNEKDNYYGVIFEKQKNSNALYGEFGLKEEYLVQGLEWGYCKGDKVICLEGYCKGKIGTVLETQDSSGLCALRVENNLLSTTRHLIEPTLETIVKRIRGEKNKAKKNKAKKELQLKTSLIKGVYFNIHKGITTVTFSDGDVVMVTVQKGDKFSKRDGVLLCIAKKFLNVKSSYNDVLEACITKGLTINKN